MDNNEINFSIDKSRIPSGVSRIVLFDSKGEIFSDRLIFTGNDDFIAIKAKTGKATYRPHELVDMEIAIADRRANPVQTSFSLSVRDGMSEVENNHSILTDLLLMSEIKGYVHNPSWYFECYDDAAKKLQAMPQQNYRATCLDLLLMVQGWRRHSWKQLTGVDSLQINYLPEQGLETHGRIVSSVRQKPQPKVDVLLMLQKKDDGVEQGGSFFETFVSDNQGRFSFVSDVPGRWNMVLSVSEKGKKKDHRILLDRVFNPDPKRYRYTDLQVSIADNITDNLNDQKILNDIGEDESAFFAAFRDSITRSGIDKSIVQLPEVEVKVKRRTKEQDIFRTRSTSIAYYDVDEEMNNIYDRGKYVGNDIHEMLKLTNKNFSTINHKGTELLVYKGKVRSLSLFIINYNQVFPWNEIEYFKYKNIRLNEIKSIYINENPSVKCQYANLELQTISTCEEIDRIFSCVVFIETYTERQIPVEGAKGVRKTWLEGYSPVKEFYSPNYSELPPDPNDYRRTLYWNPMVTTDESGKAKIHFYNNSRCTNFSISAETVTSQVTIGVNKEVKNPVKGYP